MPDRDGHAKHNRYDDEGNRILVVVVRVHRFKHVEEDTQGYHDDRGDDAQYQDLALEKMLPVVHGPILYRPIRPKNESGLSVSAAIVVRSGLEGEVRRHS